MSRAVHCRTCGKKLGEARSVVHDASGRGLSGVYCVDKACLLGVLDPKPVDPAQRKRLHDDVESVMGVEWGE